MSKRRRKKKKINNGFSIVIFVVIIFCICLGIQNKFLKSESKDLSQKKETIENQLEDEKQRTKDLEEFEKYMKTKKFMEEVAKEKLGLVYPDEILIKPEED